MSISPVVPADGIVNVLWKCGGDCAENIVPDQLQLRELDRGDVATLEVLERGVDAQGDVWGVFRPVEPLVPESSYELVLDDPFYVGHEVVQVVAAAPELDPTTLDVETFLYEVGEPAGQEICCGVPLNDSCNAPACFWTKQSVTAELALSFDTRNPRAGEWLYAVTWSAAGAETSAAVPGSMLSRASRAFDVAADAYCYEVEATRIADQAKVTVASGCLENTLGPLGERPTELEDYASALIECDEPPKGYEQDWCSEVDAACERTPGYREGICEHRDETCEPADRGEAVASDPVPADDAQDDGSAASAEASGEGCSVGSRGNPGWALACALFLTTLARRRRGLKRSS